MTPHEGLNSLTMPKLWLHECTRVVSDRLIEAQDNQWFLEQAMRLLKDEFSLNGSDIIGHLDPEDKNQASLESLRRLFLVIIRR